MNAHAQTSVAAHYEDEPSARAEFEAAFYSGASSDTIINAGRRWGEAQQATETLDERAFRLGLKAAEKDAEAERHLAAAADAAGLAAGRRLRGNDDGVAASCDREAAVCTELGQQAQAEAERLRSQAASIRKAQRFGADVLAILQGA